ncbi:hypothetical protein WA158_006844 [Blastocystis sp. Blastoise]
MENIEHSQEYAEASKLLETFKYNKKYGLVNQLKEAVENNKFKVLRSSIMEGDENVVCLRLEVPVADNQPSSFELTLTLMQQSYPRTAPVVHIMKNDSFVFNLFNGSLDEYGYLCEEKIRMFSPPMTFIDLCDYLVSLVKEHKIFVSEEDAAAKLNEESGFDIPDNVPIIDKSDLTFVDKIDYGIFGSFYKYTYKGEIVCVKKLNQRTPMDIKYLKREIEVLNQLNHPNIIKMYGLTKMDDKYQIVTKYVSGGDLFKFIQLRTESIEKYTTSFCSIFMKLVSAVAACHEKNIVHRDIKPSNILMEIEDNPILIGFELARVIDPIKDKDITHCGTREYAAPELFGDSIPITNKCDIYSLGLVGYYILTGIDIAFEMFSRQSNKKMDPQYVIPFKPKLNNILYTLFQDCCQYDPEKRPSADEIYSRLSTYEGPLYVNSLE